MAQAHGGSRRHVTRQTKITDDELWSIVDMRFLERRTLREIGHVLGRTQEAVRTKLKEMGMPTGVVYPSEEEVIHALNVSSDEQEAWSGLKLGCQVGGRLATSYGLSKILRNARTQWKHNCKELEDRHERRLVIRLLRGLARELGHTPRQKDLKGTRVNFPQLKRLFGGAQQAMQQAGLVPNPVGKPDQVSPIPTGFAADLEPTEKGEELYQRAKRLGTLGARPPAGTRTPEKVTVSLPAFRRDPKVVAWVQQDARYICESCGIAGYEDDDGDPHLEVHHMVALSDEGADTVTNAVAVCETCHGRLHHWRDRDILKEGMYRRIARLLR
jgi:5-methylcytosine-specific restriction endonuclease McrA